MRASLVRGARQAAGGSDRGQALVEFAFVLPVLLLLILGLIDVARAVEQENTLAFAAREATRYAIVHGSASTSPISAQTCGETEYTTTAVTAGSGTVSITDANGLAKTSNQWNTAGAFAVATTILVDAAGGTSNMETIKVASVGSTTLTATFTKSHSGTWSITAACSNAAITAVVERNAIGVPNVTVTVGFPDGDNDRNHRVFVDATAPFVPLPSQYLLNGALSITLRGGSMLVIQW